MKKLLIGFWILSLFLIVGCSGNTLNSGVIEKNYTYVIEHSGFVTDDIYEYASESGTAILVSLWKEYADGSREEAQGIWSTNIGSVDDDTHSLHKNYLTIKEGGTGLLKAYIKEDNIYAERRVYVYYTKVDSQGDYLRQINFFPEKEEADIIFNGLDINAPNGIFLTDETKLEDVIEIPTDGYLYNLSFDNLDDMAKKIMILKTAENYFVKIKIRNWDQEGILKISYLTERKGPEFAY